MDAVRVGSRRRRVRGGYLVLREWRIKRVVVEWGGERVVVGVGVGYKMGFWSVKRKAGDLVRQGVGEHVGHSSAL